MFGLITIMAVSSSVYAADEARDLSNFSGPGIPFTISITLNPPGGTEVVAMEEIPPANWAVSNISDGGFWDTQSKKIKWGLFFNPSIPEMVSYDIMPPLGNVDDQCFLGIVSYDGSNLTIGGDLCTPPDVPTLSVWGLMVFCLALLIGGAVIQHRFQCDQCIAGR